MDEKEKNSRFNLFFFYTEGVPADMENNEQVEKITG